MNADDLHAIVARAAVIIVIIAITAALLGIPLMAVVAYPMLPWVSPSIVDIAFALTLGGLSIAIALRFAAREMAHFDLSAVFSFVSGGSIVKGTTLIVMACLLLTACDGLPTSANAAATPEFRTGVSALGRVDVASHTRRLAPRRRGVIETLNVDVGSAVKAGELLARLHCETEEAAVTAAAAALQLARAERQQLRSGAREDAIMAARSAAAASSQRMAGYARPAQALRHAATLRLAG